MRAGHHPRGPRVSVHVGEIPDHHQAHGDVRERLTNAAGIAQRLVGTVGRQVMGPVRVPLARVGTAPVLRRPEPAWCIAGGGGNRAKVKLGDLEVIVQHAPRHGGGDLVREIGRIARQPDDVVRWFGRAPDAADRTQFNPRPRAAESRRQCLDGAHAVVGRVDQRPDRSHVAGDGGFGGIDFVADACDSVWRDDVIDDAEAVPRQRVRTAVDRVGRASERAEGISARTREFGGGGYRVHWGRSDLAPTTIATRRSMGGRTFTPSRPPPPCCRS